MSPPHLRTNQAPAFAGFRFDREGIYTLGLDLASWGLGWFGQYPMIFFVGQVYVCFF